MSSVYTITKIAHKTWRISEAGKVNCYLLEGDTSALLIDSCWGVGDLYGVVKSITSKPLLIVATHLHPDHVGGTKQFGNYYVHEADLNFINKAMCCSLACYVGGHRIGSSEKHRKAKISRPVAIKDGYSAWNGHFEGALSLNMANRVYALVNEIIDKYKKGQLQKNDSPYPNDHAMPNVRFRMDNILKSLND